MPGTGTEREALSPENRWIESVRKSPRPYTTIQKGSPVVASILMIAAARFSGETSVPSTGRKTALVRPVLVVKPNGVSAIREPHRPEPDLYSTPTHDPRMPPLTAGHRHQRQQRKQEDQDNCGTIGFVSHLNHPFLSLRCPKYGEGVHLGVALRSYGTLARP